MATYASPTNPFIKPDSGQPVAGGRQQSVALNGKEAEPNSGKVSAPVSGKRNKNAPGMARPQNNQSAVSSVPTKGGSKRDRRRAASKKKDKLEAETNELIDIGQVGEEKKISSDYSGGTADTGYNLITDAKVGLTTNDDNNNNSNEPSMESCCTRKADLNNASSSTLLTEAPTSSSSSSVVFQNISLDPLTLDDSRLDNGKSGVVDGDRGDAIAETCVIRAEKAASGVSVGNNKLVRPEVTPDDCQTGGLIELVDVKLDQMSGSDTGGGSEISGLESDKNKKNGAVEDVVVSTDAVVNLASEYGPDEDVGDEDEDVEDDDEDETLIDGVVDINSIKTSQDERAPMEQDSRRHQHIELIKKLRLQLRDLERYAYERGELEQVPPSILAERQSVILDMLKKKLPLNIDKDRIEKLELEELKCQVDKEISDLIDPLITKDHLLNQLKTQLTDLERYISHLHETIGKNFDKSKRLSDCSCQLHGCTTPKATVTTFKSLNDAQNDDSDESSPSTGILSDETLPKTSRLIRGLMAQLICSDMKIQEAMKTEKDFSKFPGQSSSSSSSTTTTSPDLHKNSSNPSQHHSKNNSTFNISTKAPQFHDGTVWTMHIDKVQLATDSLTNLFAVEPKNDKAGDIDKQCQVDESLVESVVRRQLVPAIRDLLAYGLIDPNLVPRTTYRSFLFDPYYLISSFTCLPGSQSSSELESSLKLDKIHAWDVIEDYFKSRIEPEFKNSSIKTLSQSFNLTPSMNGPIKITSKQALLIAVDDIRERLARCKPNGPESHFKLFVYTALNQAKLATWIRIVFRNKSTLKKYYHNFSFTNQYDKMDKFLSIIEALSQIEFKLNIDTESVDQFVSAF